MSAFACQVDFPANMFVQKVYLRKPPQVQVRMKQSRKHSETTLAARLPLANLHFEGSIDDVLSSKFWEAILGNKLLCNAHSTAEPSYRICSSSFSHCSRYRNDIEEHGYMWGVVIPESETKHLAKGIHRLVAAGWPPVCVFVSDPSVECG